MTSARDFITLEVMGYILDARGITFSKNEALKIVGGRRRLERLVRDGEVRVTKDSDHQHGIWRCNAADVLLNIKI